MPHAPGTIKSYGPRGEIVGAHSDRFPTIFQGGSESILAYDRLRGLAVYCSAHVDLPWYEICEPLRPLLNWWQGRFGLQFIHAAGVGTPSGGVLIAGPSGAGKSTTALVCAQSGLGYISDDYCLVSPGTRPVAYSIYSTAKTHAHDVSALSFLEPWVGNRAEMAEGKAAFFLAECLPARLLSEFPVRAILMPRITPNPETVIVPAPSRHAFLELARNSQIQLPFSGIELIERVSQLVHRVPSYYLELGTERAGIPLAIERFLNG
jgi:hypothetical protein